MTVMTAQHFQGIISGARESDCQVACIRIRLTKKPKRLMKNLEALCQVPSETRLAQSLRLAHSGYAAINNPDKKRKSSQVESGKNKSRMLSLNSEFHASICHQLVWALSSVKCQVKKSMALGTLSSFKEILISSAILMVTWTSQD